MDPMALPTELPVNSLRILLQFVRGKTEWNGEVLAAGVTVIAYAANLASPGPKVVGANGPLGDPAPLETKVAEGLQLALDQADQPQVSMGIIPWVLIVEFIASAIVKRLLS